ncbi:MAG: hypothetical protein Q7R31_00495 [Candidatus Levybacteria bacterium]|nr:hypothetical protein [Candidatus Levybacteria bacterium]
MDIAIVNESSIKIRGKHVGFIIDPPIDGPKISADGVIYLSNDLPVDVSRVEEYRVIIKGPGEYQVSGAMITGVKADKEYVYKIVLDDVQILVAKASDISKFKGDMDSSEVLILNVNSEIEASVITNMEPRVVILYGEKKEEAAKILGKSEIKKTEKATVSKEQLPEMMEVIVLG